jgi:large subunit ribosomal protein L7A
LLKELRSREKVIGVKQSRRAIREGRARQVFLACDADPALTGPLLAQCREKTVPVESGCTMRELGQAAGIQVGAAVVVLLEDR